MDLVCRIQWRIQGGDPRVPDPPFSLAIVALLQLAIYQFVAIVIIFDSMIAPVVLMYQLPKECSG